MLQCCNIINNFYIASLLSYTFFILILGLGVVGIPAGLIASALTAVRRKEENDSKKNN